MASISASDYQKLCTDFLANVIRRPRMYYQDLNDVMLIMNGMEIPFHYLCGIEASQLFHRNFSDWLYGKTGESCADGWANAIKRLADARKSDCDSLFAEFVQEFLSEWKTVDIEPVS